MAVRLSLLRAGRPLPSGRFLELISVRGLLDPRAIVLLEGLGQLKIIRMSMVYSQSHIAMLPVKKGRAVAQRLDAGFPPRLPGFAYGQHVGFVVDKAALGQIFSEYFGFPCQSFHRFLHYRNHPGLTK
jgi:hypothetical protein